MGFPTMRNIPLGTDDGAMKKLLLISVPVFALLVLALGGWAMKAVLRTPAYASAERNSSFSLGTGWCSRTSLRRMS